MRGKFAFGLPQQVNPVDPSMRPAHYAREVAFLGMLKQGAGGPSMRPAHYAREVGQMERSGSKDRHPSMRPAHYAREVGRFSAPANASSCAFNEARALCAGS